MIRATTVLLCLGLAASARAQVARTPAPSPEAKGQPTAQGFSVVLILGDAQSTTIGDTVPPAARKALADMKDFLPYRGYRLLDAQWILGSQRSTSRLRGTDDQEYQLTLRTTTVAGGRISVTFQLQEPESGPVSPREVEETNARRATEGELRARLEQLERAAAAMKDRGDRQAVQGVAAEIDATRQRLSSLDTSIVTRRRTVIDTSFAMDIGETVVVGTSRMRGGDKALIALLTAVPRSTK